MYVKLVTDENKIVHRVEYDPNPKLDLNDVLAMPSMPVPSFKNSKGRYQIDQLHIGLSERFKYAASNVEIGNMVFQLMREGRTEIYRGSRLVGAIRLEKDKGYELRTCRFYRNPNP